MFNIKEMEYALRDCNIIYHNKFENVTDGNNTFIYYGYICAICYQMKLKRQYIFIF